MTPGAGRAPRGGRGRTGLQTWLVGSFVGVGAAASLVVLLVLLPTLESSVVSGSTDRVSVEVARVLKRLSEIPAPGVTLSDGQAREYVARVAGEARGGVLFRTTGGRTYAAGLDALPDALDPTAIGPEGEAALSSPTGDPVRARVAEQSDGSQMVYSGVKVTQAGFPVGLLEVVVPVPLPTAEIGELQRRVLLAVLGVLLLASLIGFALSRVLGRRIGRVAATAASLSAGDLSARAPEAAPREVATLANGLNGMADRVQGLVATVTGERDRARSLVGGLAEGVVMIAPEDHVLIANAAATRMLGLLTPGDATRADLPTALADLVDRARKGAEPLGAAEVGTPDGRALATTAVALAEPPGTVVLTLRDVTHERALERTRRELVANVSHELKTPVAALKGFLELLEDERMDPAARREFLGLMTAETERLERLVEEQMELARLDSGGLPLDLEDMDLAALVEEASRPRAVLAARDGVDLVVEARGPVPMRGDGPRLEQVLLILLDNAERHTPAGGRIDVRADVDGPDAVLVVSDTGEGIPRASLDSVFDRFYRADPARESRGRAGAGLGLAIARGIVRAHGGEITVASEPGSGAAFTVRLPRDPA